MNEVQDASPLIICLGDLVVDLISQEPGRPLWAVSTFEKHLGGSPANVAIGLHSMGIPVALWSKVGDDANGRYLRHRLRALGLSTDGIVVDPVHLTKVALIGLDEHGDRTWEMLNPDSAYENIGLEDVNPAVLKTARVLHLGGAALVGARTAETVLHLVRMAKTNGCLVSFDPNLIVGNAPERANILRRLDALLPWVDVLKMSIDDWRDLLGETSPESVLARRVSLVIRTEGGAGSHCYRHHECIFVETEPVDVVDATGAGDAFTASILANVARMPRGFVPADLSPHILRKWGRNATECARDMLRSNGAVAGYDVGNKRVKQ